MAQQNESAKKLEVGKDYVSVHNNDVIVIDRLGAYRNRGFENGDYEHDLFCSRRTPENWREATEEEVVEAFKKHLIHRYGEDWETMKIKERHPSLLDNINDGSWDVEILKEHDGWNVWNENGLLYCDGIWVERLDEEPKIMKKYKLKQWYPSLCDDIEVGAIIDCEDDGIYYTNKRGYKRYFEIDECELYHKDFWELIEEEKPKPLFITDDGVEVFDRDTIVYSVRNNSFEKIEISASHLSKDDLEHKVFFDKYNADKYIWQNKRVFSYEDFQRWGCLHYESEITIVELAKKRSKE